jgi:hypothetical protein
LTYALSNTKEDSDAWLLGFYTYQVLDIFWWDPLSIFVGGVLAGPIALMLGPMFMPLLSVLQNADDPITFIFTTAKETFYECFSSGGDFLDDIKDTYIPLCMTLLGLGAFCGCHKKKKKSTIAPAPEDGTGDSEGGGEGEGQAHPVTKSLEIEGGDARDPPPNEEDNQSPGVHIYMYKYTCTHTCACMMFHYSPFPPSV